MLLPQQTGPSWLHPKAQPSYIQVSLSCVFSLHFGLTKDAWRCKEPMQGESNVGIVQCPLKHHVKQHPSCNQPSCSNAPVLAAVYFYVQLKLFREGRYLGSSLTVLRDPSSILTAQISALGRPARWQTRATSGSVFN